MPTVLTAFRIRGSPAYWLSISSVASCPTIGAARARIDASVKAQVAEYDQPEPSAMAPGASKSLMPMGMSLRSFGSGASRCYCRRLRAREQ